MSEIKRLTLISDPTDEFPNNANNSFKVRLPERLSLPGEGWHASLMSLTVPDQGQSNAIIAADPHTKVIKFKMSYVIRKWVTGMYRFAEVKTVDCVLELEEIMNASQIVATGSQFWKRVMQEVHNKIMTEQLRKQSRRKTDRVYQKNRHAPTDLERGVPGDSGGSQKGFDQPEQHQHGGVLHQLGHCAQVWIGAQKDVQD